MKVNIKILYGTLWGQNFANVVMPYESSIISGQCAGIIWDQTSVEHNFGEKSLDLSFIPRDHEIILSIDVSAFVNGEKYVLDKLVSYYVSALEKRVHKSYLD